MALALRVVQDDYTSPWSRSPVVTTRPGETVVDSGAGIFIYRNVRRTARRFPLPGMKMLVVEFDEADVVAAGTPSWSVSKLRVIREVEPDEAARIADGEPLA